jgi:hypothetical protein
VIIQGLRESGIFSSVIISAIETSESKDNFLKSVESSNSSRATTSGVVSSRKMINRGESQATVRRVLETKEVATHPLAIPPLSPPGLHDFHIDT